MKNLYVNWTLLIIILCSITAYSQVLSWSECDLNFAGSPSNFNYSKTFNGVPQSNTDVELTIGFIVCQPYTTNSAGIRLNGTTFSQDNVPANSCSALFTTYIISKSVFNQAVINGDGTIVFSYFVRDNCPSGWGCSFANDPCINFTVSYTECTTQVTPTFNQVQPICAGTTLAALPVDSSNGINGTWSPAINNLETTLYTFTPTAGQCATSTTMNIAVNPNVTPTFTQVAPICAGAALAALPVDSSNGINGSWSPEINSSETTLYTFTPTEGQCATATTMTVTVNPEVPAPTGDANQTFCDGETVGNLIVEGNSVEWYDASVSGNSMNANTVLTSGSTYYASQTIDSCQSMNRLAVTVTNGACLSLDNFENGKIAVFPNPIKNTLNITYKENLNKVIIFNSKGQEVINRTMDAKECSIDTSNLASGTYLVKIITSNNTIKTIKVIKE